MKIVISKRVDVSVDFKMPNMHARPCPCFIKKSNISHNCNSTSLIIPALLYPVRSATLHQINRPSAYDDNIPNWQRA